MEHINIAVNAVLPVFIVILVGYYLKEKEIINQTFVKTSMKLVFNLSLPALLFSKVSKSNLQTLASKDSLIFLASIIAITLLAFFISNLIAGLVNIKQADKGTFVQGSFRGNYVIIGFPILYNIFADAAVEKMALSVIVAVPLLNILSIIALSNNHKPDFKSILLAILKNPLILGIFFGFMVPLFKITIPSFLDVTIGTLGQLATPMGLIGIGAYLSFKTLPQVKENFLAIFLKLVLFPGLAILLAFIFKFSHMEATILLVLFGSPAAISSFVMATALNGNSQLAANIVIFTTVTSLFTFITGLSFLSMIF